MATIICFNNWKGGVSKTTSTINTGYALLQQNKKVLVIDLDPQANVTTGLGLNPKQVEYTVYEVLLNAKKGLDFAILHTKSGLDLVPSGFNLAQAETEVNQKMGREALLSLAIAKMQEQYDFILIDTPPLFSIFSQNALVASHFVIIPTQPEKDSYDAIPKTLETIKIVQDEANEELQIAGILCTMVDKRNGLHMAIDEKIRRQYSNLVFETFIPQNIKLAEAQAFSQPVGMYDPNCTGANAYVNFTSEILSRYGKQEK